VKTSQLAALIMPLGDGRYSAEIEDVPGTRLEFDTEGEADEAAERMALFFYSPQASA